MAEMQPRGFRFMETKGETLKAVSPVLRRSGNPVSSWVPAPVLSDKQPINDWMKTRGVGARR